MVLAALAFAAIAHGTLVGFLIAFLIALVVGALVYAAGVWVLHAPQQAVGLIAFIVFLIVFLLAAPL